MKAADDAAMVVRLPAAASSVPESRVAVRQWCDDFSESRAWDIALAVSEAVSNVVRHAYPQGDGEFELRGDVQDGDLVVEVRDWGVGIHASSLRAGLGTGLTIIHKVSDGVVIQDCAPGTLVSLWFSGTRPPGG
jgi:anti-sigma regulatory factor (Ser/Thr protein kinase)